MIQVFQSLDHQNGHQAQSVSLLFAMRQQRQPCHAYPAYPCAEHENLETRHEPSKLSQQECQLVQLADEVLYLLSNE